MPASDHALFDPFSGVVLDPDEGKKIALALGSKKAAILQNHGLLTVGPTIEAAAWWYLASGVDISLILHFFATKLSLKRAYFHIGSL
jgi:hypothetical protein